ncbi:MAG: hypothetical protein NTU80_09840, partial [Verrucomicrobia bacterium]|nr:hypothetical protein [Verrucomicrobiota bacterium]
TLAKDTQVFLVSNATVGNDAQRVLLNKQPITVPSGSVAGTAGPAVIGNYAWWVGDEGIKASVSLVDQNLTAKPLNYDNTDYTGSKPGDNWLSTTDEATIRKRNQLNQLSQPRPVIERVVSALKPDADDLTALPKVITFNQLSTVPTLSATPGTAEQVKSAFHDLTVLSRGVLADTRTGQLRTDFTPANTNIPAIDSYIKLRPDVPPTAASPYVSVFHPRAPSWDGTGAPTWPIFGITPVMTEAALYFSFDVAGGMLNLKYWLMFELWNPYTATLEINKDHSLKYSVTLPSPISFLVKQYDKAAYDSALSSVPSTTPVVKASQLVTLPGGTVLSGTTGSNTISINPGRVVTLRGDSTLDYSRNSVLMGTLSSAPTSLAALNSSPAVHTTVDLQTAVAAGMEYKLQLASDDSLLQSCTVKSSYEKTTDTAISTVSSCLAFGYTFNVANLLYSTGQFPYCFDPRLPKYTGIPYYDLRDKSQWCTKPDTNAAVNNVNPFKNGFRDRADFRLSPYDLPRQELISVAELRHLIGPSANGLGSFWGSATANQLFDQAFFSTVPQNYDSWPADGTEPRPNRYLDIYKPDGVSEATLADLRDKTKSARFQLICGAFNINSTSIAAWMAILSSQNEKWDFPKAYPATKDFATTTLNNAFFRTPAGAKEVNWPIRSTTLPSVLTSASMLTSIDSSSAVGRQLSDPEIASLATQIVNQLKTRGRPFVSLTDFIGSFYSNSDTGSASPGTKWDQSFLEYAINKATSDKKLGQGLNGDYMSVGSSSYGSDCVTQGDILGKVSPFIAARSDTFIIRSYGDVQNPVTSVIQGRAWCEATVQRLPDLVSDPAADAATVAAPPLATNPFGRRFKIISFRWLTTNDI